MHVILIVIGVKIITASDRGILELWEANRLLSDVFFCVFADNKDCIFLSLLIYFLLMIVFWVHINQDITFFQIFPEPGKKRWERYNDVI